MLFSQLPNFPYVPFLPLTRIKGFELLGKQLDAPSTSDHVDTPQPGPKDAEVEVPASIHDPITPREADAPAGPTPDLATSVVDVVESVVVSSSLAAPTPDPLLPTTVPSPTETETEFMILLGGERWGKYCLIVLLLNCVYRFHLRGLATASSR